MVDSNYSTFTYFQICQYVFYNFFIILIGYFLFSRLFHCTVNWYPYDFFQEKECFITNPEVSGSISNTLDNFLDTKPHEDNWIATTWLVAKLIKKVDIEHVESCGDNYVTRLSRHLSTDRGGLGFSEPVESYT